MPWLVHYETPAAEYSVLVACFDGLGAVNVWRAVMHRELFVRRMPARVAHPARAAQPHSLPVRAV